MNIISANYVTSFNDIRNFDIEPLPSIAFIGRSNVGKSSLMNHLLDRKSLVKTSSTPGKTQTINYFLINGFFYFVDLPGYGFTHAPVSVKKSWRQMIEAFLEKKPFLQLIVQLVDIRHEPSKEDIVFQQLLKVNQIPNILVANKADKLKKSQFDRQIKLIIKTLELTTPPVIHSASKKIGREELINKIAPFVQSG
ncbi:MAG: ribosome biogenesis GTP-binding protein YihA/YsxC [Deltaproteobacteria bacterium]|nr:ribosome biogenesis GTP-binding protein YihA/YsxC [Deltaproteobacteria bacterium]